MADMTPGLLSPTAATVISLAASVRVLQVGRRQITQSVASQLDACEPWELAPMGRVKLSRKETSPSGDSFRAERSYAVGSHRETGELRLALAHRCEVHRMQGAGEWILRGRAPTGGGREWDWREHPDHPFEEWMTRGHPKRCPCCAGCTNRVLEARAGRLGAHYPLPPDHADMPGNVFIYYTDTGGGPGFGQDWIDGLPLIVLAGLR